METLQRTLRHHRAPYLRRALLLLNPRGGDIGRGFIGGDFTGAVGRDTGSSVLAFEQRQRGTFNKTFKQYVFTSVGSRRIERQLGSPPSFL